jgi:hypothetical protein
MRLATTQDNFDRSLKGALGRILRPAVGFSHPRDVLKDPLIDTAEKRAILASWASDASAVQDMPSLRWLLGTAEPVALQDVREALTRLDALERDSFPPTGSTTRH